MNQNSDTPEAAGEANQLVKRISDSLMTVDQIRRGECLEDPEQRRRYLVALKLLWSTLGYRPTESDNGERQEEAE